MKIRTESSLFRIVYEMKKESFIPKTGFIKGIILIIFIMFVILGIKYLDEASFIAQN